MVRLEKPENPKGGIVNELRLGLPHRKDERVNAAAGR